MHAAQTPSPRELRTHPSTSPPHRALNGLGYAYFYGESLPGNKTKAFEYFLRAAEMESDTTRQFVCRGSRQVVLDLYGAGKGTQFDR